MTEEMRQRGEEFNARGYVVLAQALSRQQVAALCQEVISHHQGIAAICDTEARGTARKGDLALCFNAMAQGLALLAFCPGGIVFAGHHWEAQTPEVPA